MSRPQRSIWTWLAPVLALLALLGIWEVYVDSGAVSNLVLPAPHNVAQAMWNHRRALWHNLVITGVQILCGVALACVTALAVAMLTHFSLAARRALYPLLVGSQALPIVIVAPILILWLGFGLLPKLIVIGLVCFFPIVVTTLAALDAVGPDMLKLMATLDASRWQTFRRVELPAALPGLFTGAKLAAVFSVIGAVFAEQAGSNSGLGYLLTITLENLETAEAFAAVVLLCAFAVALFTLLTVIERRVLPWAYRRRTAAGR